MEMMEGDPRKQFVATAKKILETGEYSDVTVTCGSSTYKAHRVIVCSRSQFFADACGAKSEEKKVVDLPDEDPKTVKLLMQFMYEGDYAPVVSEVALAENTESPRSVPSAQPSSSNSNPSRSASGSSALGSTLDSGSQVQLFPHTCPNRQSNRKSSTGAEAKPCYQVLCPHHTCSKTCVNYSSSQPSGCFAFSCFACLSMDGDRDFLTHVKMYAIADRLKVYGLKELAHLEFQLTCEYFWNSSGFGDAVEYVFKSIPDADSGLRSLVRKTITKNMSTLNNGGVYYFLAEELWHGVQILRDKAMEHGW